MADQDALSAATGGMVRPLSRRLLLPVYALTLFISAGLLFLVEPMLTKMLLPQLGGTPNVWNTCLFFFQASLLLGYLYAHTLARYLGLRVQLAVHLSVLLLATVFLPLDPVTGAAPPANGSPVLWLLLRLTVTVGVPFVAVAASAPLLQRWFSLTDHADASDPYFLYASSNAGSLLALLVYPLVVEPMLPLTHQSRLWSAGFYLLIGGIFACWISCRIRPEEQQHDCSTTDAGTIGVRDRFLWVIYAFVPSSLLLGVTTDITTDLASAPLFWVIPLALYLSTFILVFARRPPLPHRWAIRLMAALVIPLVVLWATPFAKATWLLPLHLAVFFMIAMVCHGELAARRPQTSNLTEFYLCMSLGGVLGGLFNALIAPVIFPDVWEYPLMIVAACLLRPAATGGGKGPVIRDILLPAVMLVIVMVFLYVNSLPIVFILAAVATTAVALWWFSKRRLRFALGVGVWLLAGQIVTQMGTVETLRSFFGVYRVLLTDHGRTAVLVHGTTAHGAESTIPGKEKIPLTYYAPTGPFGSFFRAAESRHPIKRVGVIGLGAGSLACYAKPGQEWTFHEIDPLVEKIASDGRFFHFLSKCGRNARIVLGDARQTLHDVPDGFYDVIVLDAFSSDTIPVHLMTREALSLYQRKLAPGGVILYHISNRYLRLAPVVEALADDAGVAAKVQLHRPPKQTIEDTGAWVVAVAQKGGNLDFLTPQTGWKPPTGPRAALWTDERSDIISVINWSGLPAAIVKDIRDHARQLQQQLIPGGQTSPDLRYSQGAALIETADSLLTKGDTKGALAAARQAHRIFQRLLAAAPGRSDHQRDLAASDEKIGDVLQAQGDLAGALAAYREGFAIIKALARKDAGNTIWQLGLSYSDNEIGDVLQAQGDLAGALAEYRTELAIRKALVRKDPSNTGWQRDLAASDEKIGDVLQAQGDLTGALAAYRTELAIMEPLAKKGPSNTDWQRFISVVYEKIGGVLQAQGDLAGALAGYRAEFAIMEPLAKKDPSNTDWQRFVSVVYDKIGDVLQAQGDLAGAIAAYRDGLAIRKVLARKDPGNTEWQTDVVVSLVKLASAGIDARANLTEALAILKRLDAAGRLPSDKKGWIATFETALKKT